MAVRVLEDAVLAPDSVRAHAVEAAWNHLTAAGPLLMPAQRIGVIAAARRAWAGEHRPPDGGELLVEAAHWLAVDAGGITADLVADLETRGLDRHRYLETVGVVAMTANIDFYVRGLGASLPTLPEPRDEPPTGAIDPDAGITDGFVPATGPLLAPFVLDALPTEGKVLRALHEPMYMPMHEMGDHAYRDLLTRPQIELIAARTSELNECFY